MRWAAISLALLGLAAGGCASSVTATGAGDAEVRIDREYAVVFDAARDAVREMGWDLDRVDAARGVISTRPRSSAGWITPWIPHAGALHRDERVATVRLRPASLAAEPPVTMDLREQPGPWDLEVTVDVYRRYELDRRADPTTVRLTHSAPAADRPRRTARGRVGADVRLAERLAAQIDAGSLAAADPATESPADVDG
jgi:hypothetical protein